MSDQEGIAEWIETIRSVNVRDERYSLAHQQLVESGRAAVDALVPLLQNRNTLVRLRASEILSEIYRRDAELRQRGLHILLLDNDQLPIEGPGFGFLRLTITGNVEQDRGEVGRLLSEPELFDLVVLGHTRGYGLSLVSSIPAVLRPKVVVVSEHPLSSGEMKQYERLLVRLFTVRGGEFEAFLADWARS